MALTAEEKALLDQAFSAPPTATPGLTPTPSAPTPSAGLTDDERRVLDAGFTELRFGAAAARGAQANPDEFAQRKRIADELKTTFGEDIPPILVDVPQAQSRLAQARADRVTADRPLTRAWITQNPELGIGDAESLSGIESITKALKGAPKSFARGALNIPGNIASMAGGIEDVLLQGVEDLTGIPLAKSEMSRLGQLATRGVDALLPRERAEGVVAEGIQSGFESLGANLPVLLGSAAVKGGSSLAAYLLGAGAGGASVRKAQEQGASAYQAGALGVLDAIAEVVTEKIGLDELFKTDAFKKAFLRQAAKFTAKEMGGEQLATVWQDANEWLILNPEKDLSEFLAERPRAAAVTAIATLIGAGGQIAVVKGLERLAAQSPEEMKAAEMARLFDLAAQNETLKRDPKGFAEFFQTVGEDAFVYVEPNVLAETLAEAGVPEEKVQALAARADGGYAGMLEIPVSDIVTALADTGAEQAIIPHLRVGSPDAQTLIEAREESSKAAEFFQTESKRILEDDSTKQEFRDSAERVRTDIETRLSAAAPYTKQQVKDFSSHLGAFYEVTASRLGITPEQLREGWTDATGKQHRGYRPAFLDQAQYDAKQRGDALAQGVTRTDTPEFKAWFGGSKVVDANGKPLVVYHGTETAGFSAFNPDLQGSAVGRSDVRGFYFTESKQNAETYSGTRRDAEIVEDFEERQDGAPGIYAVYLSLRNPYEIDFAGRNFDGTSEDDAEGDPWFRMDNVVKRAIEEGYDGVIATDVTDEGRYGQGYGWGRNTYVAFRPEQIKSAIGNRGTFDPNDPNILNQAGPARAAVSQQVGENFLKMAKALGKDAFRYKDIVSDIDLKKVLASIGQTDIELRKLDKAESERSAADEAIELTTADGKKGYLYRFGRDVQIDVSKLESGQSRGSAIYQSVANWAEANGYFFEGDAAGITLAGLIRRTENMVSSIARHRSSDHLRPHDEQLRPANAQALALGFTPIQWATGETERNLGELLISGYNTVKALYPEIENVRATEFGDFTRLGELDSLDFTNPDGELLADSDFAGIVREIEARYERFRKPGQEGRISPIGVSTVKRAAVVGELLRQATLDGRGGVLPGVETLRGQLYQGGYVGAPNAEYAPDEKFITEAKKHFGTTLNPNEAGYVLPDGTMLDFSGRHYASRDSWPYLKGQRNVDHRELTGEGLNGHTLDDMFTQTSGSGNDFMHEFMARTGAMRVDFNAGVSSGMRPPTEAQLKVIGKATRGAWSATSYIDAVNGRIIADAEWENTKPADVTAFFTENKDKSAPPGAPLWQLQAPTFYSQLARVFETAKMNAAPAGQWLSWLNSNAAKLQVKKDEIEWTGIREWLEARGDQKTSKEEIAEYLRANGVQVTEVGKGGPGAAGSGAYVEYNEEDDKWFVYSRNDAVIEAFAAGDEANAYLRSGKGDTKYASYQLPGGQNYRELLLTLPVKRADVSARDAAYAAFDRGEISRDERNRRIDDAAKAAGENFVSAHWDEKNILAHIRFNERADADGKRVLFIEEVQSDWGQEGKKKGFGDTKATAAEIGAEIERLKADGYITEETVLDPSKPSADPSNRGVVLFHGPTRYSSIPRGVKAKTESEAFDILARRNVEAEKKSRVSAAPFVTDTKSWLSLGIKRMIRYAAENGFDKVAFINGEQSADRYDLSKQLDELAWDEPGGRLVGYRSGDDVLNQTGVTAENLEDYVGKEAAKKLSEAKPERFDDDVTLRRISGLDLKVGGEGMKTFYDQIVPQTVNDVLKKLGGGKVADVTIPLRGPNGQPSERRAPLQQPGFDITPAMREMAMKGLPLFQPGQEVRKGAFDVDTLDIAFLAQADLSTFTHEVGHFFLTVYADLASQPDAPADIIRDMQTVLDHFGVPDLSTWNRMTLDQQRKHHEQFAETWEHYVLTGESPSQRLVPILRRMSEYLKRVYRSVVDFLRGHPTVQVSPDLKAVMDRMIATEEEIADMQERRGYVALFKDQAESGMTPEQWAAYQELAPESKQEAEDMLRSRSMRDLKWLQNMRNREIAKLQKAAKETRDATKAEVETELAQQPIYRAMRWLQLGEMTDESGNEIKATAGHKLSTEALAEMFPEGALDRPDLKKLGFGKYGMVAKEGMHPDLVAEMFGFPSGEALVRQIVDTPKLRDAVEQETDNRMLEQHSEMIDPDAVARAADEAIHNTVRTRMVATELWALSKNVGSPASLMKAAREFVRQTLGTKSAKTLKPWVFAAEEVRAGKAAAKALAKGDREGAARHKRTELVNHVLAKEAHAALRELEKATEYLKKIAGYKDDASSVTTRDGDLVRATRAILGAFGIGTHARVDQARAYIKALDNYDPDLAAAVTQVVDDLTGNEKDYRALTLDEMRELRDAIETLWYIAKRSRQMVVEGKRLQLADLRAELASKLIEFGDEKAVLPGEKHAMTKAEKAKQKFSVFVNKAKRVEQWVTMKDHSNYGPFRKYVWNVINDAQVAYEDEKALRLKQLKAILEPVMSDFVPRKIDATSTLGYTFGGGDTLGYSELLHALLHTGNESNKRKLLLGRGWASENADGSLNTTRWDAFLKDMHDRGVLTKKHWDFVQSVWDFMEDLKPGAQKAYRETYGRSFDEITANTVKTPFGDYRGGYVPARQDSRLVEDAAMREQIELGKESMMTAFPTPKKGFTKGRTEYNVQLLLDLQSLTKHVDEVLLMSHMAVPVRDVQRLLKGAEVKSALHKFDRDAYTNMLKPWLQRATTQAVADRGGQSLDASAFWTKLRARAGFATMFGNFANAAQQLTGFFPALLKVRGKYLTHAMAASAHGPRELAHHVAAMSPYMAQRLDSEIQAAAMVVDEILLNPTKLEKAQKWAAQHAYFLQVAVDNVMSPVIWTAKYNEVMESGGSVGMDEAKLKALEMQAIKEADSAVRTTQGSNRAIDIATIESGSPFWRLFMQFVGYFNTQANLIGEARALGMTTPKMKRGYGRAAYIAAMGLLAPAIVGEVIIQLFRGGPDDEDKDGEYLDDWLRSVFFAPVKYATAMVPVFGQLTNAVVNATNDKPYDDRLGTNPAFSAVERGLSAAGKVVRGAFDEDYEPKPGQAIRDIGSLVSVFTGVPITPATKSAGYVADVVTDRVEPTGPLDVVRGTITGVASPASKQ